MNEKHFFLQGKTLGLLVVAGLMSFASCAEGVEDESFDAGVRNAQLESPVIDKDCFSTITGADGSESLKLAWDVVMGAGGYHCVIDIVDDPANPVNVVDTILDRPSLTFSKLEDTNYSVSVSTLANEKLNNKASKEASNYAYSTLVQGIEIPEGQEISSFVASNPAPGGEEYAYILKGGATYQLDAPVDFGLNQITFRGDKLNPSTIIVGENGCITTQAGLKVKFINFDCTVMSSKGLLLLSSTPDASLSTESLGYKADGANQNGYVINDVVLFQACKVKNLPHGILYGNKQPWSLRDFRITDCIIQLDSETGDTFINFYQAAGNNGLIKNLAIRNSTIYNIKNNSKNYFIRYANSSNAQPKKIFGNSDNSASYTMVNCTFSKTMAGKDFANNMPNTNTITCEVTGNIFYDTYRIQKFIQSQWKKTNNWGAKDNTIWGVTKSVDSTDKSKYATEEDPLFAGPIDVALDFSQTNGGVNFKAAGAMASEKKFGDPRWLE